MIIDIIVIAIFIIAAIWGAHKGAIKIIASIASFVLALALAYVLAGTVGEYIKGTPIGLRISAAIENRIVSEDEEQMEDETTEETLVEESKETDAIGKIEQIVGEKIEESIANNKVVIAQKVIGYVFVAIGFLTTFIVVKIVLFIVFAIVELLCKLPVLKEFNKITGAILEIILMLLKIWILLGIMNFIAPLDIMAKPIELLNQSIITKALYEHNIIVNIIINRIM